VPAPTAPADPISVGGAWSGTVEDSDAGQGTFEWVLTHTGQGLSGTYAVVFSDQAYSGSGTVAGVVTGAAGVAFLTPSVPLTCAPGISLTGLVYLNLSLAADRITGRYSSFTCGGGRVGTVELRRKS
jgi:hypothetical protein